MLSAHRNARNNRCGDPHPRGSGRAGPYHSLWLTRPRRCDWRLRRRSPGDWAGGGRPRARNGASAPTAATAAHSRGYPGLLGGRCQVGRAARLCSLLGTRHSSRYLRMQVSRFDVRMHLPSCLT